MCFLVSPLSLAFLVSPQGLFLCLYCKKALVSLQGIGPAELRAQSYVLLTLVNISKGRLQRHMLEA